MSHWFIHDPIERQCAIARDFMVAIDETVTTKKFTVDIIKRINNHNVMPANVFWYTLLPKHTLARLCDSVQNLMVDSYRNGWSRETARLLHMVIVYRSQTQLLFAEEWTSDRGHHYFLLMLRDIEQELLIRMKQCRSICGITGLVALKKKPVC